MSFLHPTRLPFRRLAHRLAAAFAMLALLTLVAGLVGVVAVAGVRGRLGAVTDRALPALLHLQAADSAVNQAMLASRGAAIDAANSPLNTRLRASAGSMEDLAWREFAAYLPYAGDSSQAPLAARARDLLARWRILDARVVHLDAAAGDAATRLSFEVEEPVARSLLADFAALGEVAQAEVTQARDQADLAANSAMAVTALTAALALALALAFGLGAARSIARPVVAVAAAAGRLADGTVADLARAMDALARGDLQAARASPPCDPPPPVRSPDEVGAMAATVGTLQRAVARIAVSLDGAREALLARSAALAREMADRSAAQEEARASAAQLQAAIGAAALNLFALDASGAFTLLVGSPLVGSGVPQHQRIGRSAFDEFADQVDSLAILRRALAGEAVEPHLMHMAGRVFEVRLAPQWAPDGRVAGVLGVALDVTERVRAAEEQAFLASIVATSAHGISAFALDGTVLVWNAGAERLHGWSAAEVIGRRLSEFLDPPGMAEERRDLLARLARGERIERVETVRLRKDGSRLHVSLSFSPILDAAGTVVGGSAISHDITKRVAAEAALRAGEARLRAIVESAVDGILTVDEQGVVETANPAAARLFRYAPGQLVGRQLSDLLPQAMPAVPQVLETGHPPDSTSGLSHQLLELSGRRRDGTTLPLYVALTAITVEGRHLLTAIVRDLTDLRQAEEEQARLLAQEQAARARAERSEATLRGIVAASPIPIVVVDQDIRVRSWNPAAERMFGWGEAEVLGQPLPLWPSDQLQQAQDLLARILDGSFPRDLEVRRQRKDGSYLDVRLSVAPLHDAAGRVDGFLGMYVDLTAQKQVLGELERARQAAEALAQLRSDFVASVSHELRTPLTAILGFAELLRAHWARMDEPARLQQLGCVIQATYRQKRLVEDLLLLNQVGSVPLGVRNTAVSLGALAAQAAQEVQASYPGQRIDQHGPHDQPAWADAARTTQILVNLLDNAAKYSPEGSPVALSWGQEGGAAVMRVVDRGRGIPPDARDYLFTRFGRVPGSQIRAGRVGTGLGLFLGRELARAMGGDLDLESTGPQGSTFRLRLPLAPAPSAPVAMTA